MKTDEEIAKISTKQRWIRMALEICDAAKRRGPLSRTFLRSAGNDDEDARQTIEFVRAWLQDQGLTEDAWYLLGMEHATFGVDDRGATIYIRDYREAYKTGREAAR